MAHHELAGVGGAPDHGEVELPFTKHALGDRLGAGLQHHEHALLALRQHHLVGGHAGLARRHLVEVELDADAAFVGHLHRRRGEPGRAHVLDGDDGVLLHQLEAGFEQQLLGEGIAHLHRRTLLGRRLVELCRGHGGAVNAVAPGLGADIDHGKPNALRRRLEDALGVDEPHGHGVDQDVVVVARVEIGLAADGGHAHAIAVVADARHDTGDEVPGLGVVGCAEAERIHVGDGPRAHGEHVAHDAADAGRGPLIRLDIGGVVVALHLEHGRLAVANVDDACILARALDHLRALGRQLLQPHPRGFVGAMLGPHHREDAELGQRRLAPEHGSEQPVFVGTQAMLGDQVRRDLRGGLVHAEEANRLAAAGCKTRAEALTEWIAGSSPAMTKPTTRRGFPPGP